MTDDLGDIRAIRIEDETHRRCREIGEPGGRTRCRVVAVHAIMGIEADEDRPGRVYGQVLHKCWGWPSGHHSNVYSGEFSAVVIGVAFLSFNVSHGLDPNLRGAAAAHRARPDWWGSALDVQSRFSRKTTLEKLAGCGIGSWAAGARVWQITSR